MKKEILSILILCGYFSTIDADAKMISSMDGAVPYYDDGKIIRGVNFTCSPQMVINITSMVLSQDTLEYLHFDGCLTLNLDSGSFSQSGMRFREIRITNVKNVYLRSSCLMNVESLVVEDVSQFVMETAAIMLREHPDHGIRKIVFTRTNFTELPTGAFSEIRIKAKLKFYDCHIGIVRKGAVFIPVEEKGRVEFEGCLINTIESGAMNLSDTTSLVFSKNVVKKIQTGGIISTRLNQFFFHDNHFGKLDQNAFSVYAEKVEFDNNQFDELGNAELTDIKPYKSGAQNFMLKFEKNVVKNVTGKMLLFDINLGYKGLLIQNNYFPCGCFANEHYMNAVQNFGFLDPNRNRTAEILESTLCLGEPTKTIVLEKQECRDRESKALGTDAIRFTSSCSALYSNSILIVIGFYYCLLNLHDS